MNNLCSRLRSRAFVFSSLAVLIAIIFVNGITVNSMLVGLCASSVYLLAGGYLLGTAVLRQERTLTRLSFGTLLFLAFIGTVSWLFVTFEIKIGVVETGGILLVSFVFLALAVISTNIRNLLGDVLRRGKSTSV